MISGQPFANAGRDSPLWADAKAKIKNLLDAGKLDSTQARELQAQAREALLSAVKPSYTRLIESLRAELSRAPSGEGRRPHAAERCRLVRSLPETEHDHRPERPRDTRDRIA